MILIMRIQTLSLMRMKAGNSGKKYGISIKFIIEMLNGFLRPLLWKRYNNIYIKKKIREMLQKLPHWIATDELQGYCIKAFKFLQDQLLNFPNLCLHLSKIPDWMVWGKTVLI